MNNQSANTEVKPQPSVGEQVHIEAAAKAIYRLFDGADAHPWVEGGNSNKQDDARRYARAAIAQARAAEPAEPAAWMCKTGHGTGWRETAPPEDIAWAWTPLYAAPQALPPQPVGEQAPLPCPFCGSADEVYHGKVMYCDNCGADGPNYERDGKPVATWNTRAAVSTRASSAPAEPLIDALKRIKFCCAVPAATSMRQIAEKALDAYATPAATASSAPADMRECPDCEGTQRISPVELCERCKASGILPASASGDLLTDQQIKDIAFDITHGDHQDDPHGYDIALARAVERYLRRAPSPSREEAPAAQAVEAQPVLYARQMDLGPGRHSRGVVTSQTADGDWIVPLCLAAPAASVAEADAKDDVGLETQLALAKEGLEVANDVMSYCQGDAWERECTEKERARFYEIYETFNPKPIIQESVTERLKIAEKFPCNVCGKKFFNVADHKKAKHKKDSATQHSAKPHK